MRYKKATRYAILVVFTFLAPALLAGLIPRAHAVTTYSLGTIPFLSQEGSTFTVVFTVYGASGNTNYQFRFVVKDPAGSLHTSVVHSYNTSSGQSQFTLPVFFYPTSSFLGPNNLVGQYFLNATQVAPVVTNPNVASTYFFILLTDQFEYQRTQTVSIKATGYTIGEPATVKITTGSTPPTTVFAVNTTADLNHQVTASWHIPRNAVLDPNGYVATVSGTTTVKTPADISGFNIKAAVMSISALNSAKSSYQRTETMSFSFQPTYPDGTIASTGVGLVTLARPGGGNVILTTAYSSSSQTFNATYKTSATNVTGTWTASLAVNGYADAWGNSGPNAKITNTPLLVPATFTISVSATTYVPIGQQVKFNATIAYPDGTILNSGNVRSFLIYTGTPTVTHTIPVTFDSGFQFWIGSYTPQTSDPGGLWSLVVNATDSPSPPNTGSASTAVTLQDRPPVASFTQSQSIVPTMTSITFNGTASYDPDGTITGYSWDFGDGFTGTGSVTSHAYATANTYTVTLTVTDNGGLTGSTNSQVTITDRPPTVSFTSSPSAPTTGQTVTLMILSSDPDGTVVQTLVAWGDGSTPDTLSGAATTDTHTYASTGSSTSQTFTVTIMVTDNSGSTGSSSASLTITDRPPVVSFTPSSTAVVTGQYVNLTISAADPDGTVASKQVNWGDGTIDVLSASATSGSHNYVSTGTSPSKLITITVSATDNSGSTGSYSRTITLSDRPPTVTIALSSGTATTGQTVTVTITSSDPDGTIAQTKVDWGDGTVDTLNGGPTSYAHSYASTGSSSSKPYLVYVTVTDNSGSTATSQDATINVTGTSSSSGNLTLPLYYFGILAVAIAALLVGGFLAFRRHRVTHARLKIDLEAVKSEAGRIENNEFFQSVKDQLKKDNEGQ